MRFETGVESVDLLLNRASSVSDAFDVADGTGTLHLRHWKGPVSAPRVLLLHGGSGSWLHWIRNVEALSKRYDVWTLDLPALGWSSDQERPYDVELAIRRIENVLGEDAKLREVHLVAFSWGCVAATLLAARHPDWVRSVCLVGPASLGVRPRPAERVRLIRRTKAMTRQAVLDAQRHNLRQLMISRDDRIDQCALHVHEINHQLARFDSAQYYASALVIDHIGALHCPLTVLYGDADAPALPDIPGIGDDMIARNPDTRFRVISDCGHWLQYEQPDLFHDELGKHLSSF